MLSDAFKFAKICLISNKEKFKLIEYSYIVYFGDPAALMPLDFGIMLSAQMVKYLQSKEKKYLSLTAR